MKTRSSRIRAALTVVGAASAAAVLAAPVAQAHVSVNPGEAEKGGYARLAFRVPNERDDASTVEVQVNLPVEEHPIGSVSVRPREGWSYELETEEVPGSEVGDDEEETVEVVSSITWSGGEVQPGEFEEFEVSMGTMPEDADELAFPAIQLYDSGEEVRWIEVSDDEDADLESPAPVLTLVDPEGGGHGDDGAEDGDDGDDEAAGVDVENVASQSDVDSANRAALAGVVVGIVGIATGAVALVRGRRSTPASSD